VVVEVVDSGFLRAFTCELSAGVEYVLAIFLMRYSLGLDNIMRPSHIKEPRLKTMRYVMIPTTAATLTGVRMPGHVALMSGTLHRDYIPLPSKL
jgi:hypothetical protein